MTLKKKLILGSTWLVLFILLAGCNNASSMDDSGNNAVEDNYYLKLMGKSEMWNLESYEVKITPKSMEVGKGTLTWQGDKGKNISEVLIQTHMVINDEDTVIHEKKVTGSSFDSNQLALGSIKGESFLDQEIHKFKDIKDIYMEIEWNEKGIDKKYSERINLYNSNN